MLPAVGQDRGISMKIQMIIVVGWDKGVPNMQISSKISTAAARNKKNQNVNKKNRTLVGCRRVIVTLTGEIQMCLSLKMNPRLIQFAHVDNVWHVHLTAVPGHFSETIVKLQLIPNSTSTLFSLPQRRLSGFPHKVGIGHFPINTRAPEPPPSTTFSTAISRAWRNWSWSGWERLREVDSTWMREQTLGIQRLKIAFHATHSEKPIGL